MIEFTLPDMTCGHCVRTVTDTVRQVDAAAQLDIDLPQHRVRIESQKPAGEFAKALTEEGYTPA
jgi:copper chaperone